MDLVRLGKGEFREDMARRVIRPPDFLKNDFLFPADLFRVEDRVPDGVGKYVDSSREGFAGKRGVVDRHVEGRVGIDSPSGAFDFSGDLAYASSLGPLEEHVLMEMGQALFPGPFVGGSHVGPDLEIGHRGESGLPEKNGEAAIELLVVDIVGGQWNPRG